VDGTCSMHGKDEKCIQSFVPKISCISNSKAKMNSAPLTTEIKFENFNF
jgi:hypothetical protein